MARRVLVVDDEAAIRRVLRAYLEAEAFEVAEASTGAEVLAAVGGPAVPDLIVLDIGLPDADGLEVLRTLRRTSDVYVVLVTARAEEIDRIVGLPVGADDNVTKPFSPREVVARVKTVLRRAREASVPAEPGPLTVGGLRLDEARREITVDGRPVALSTLEFDILRALASSPGRVFSRTQLLERVWGYDFYGDDRVVDAHVRSIRRALGDDASAPRFIGTVRGIGYKFLPEGGDR